MDWVPEVFPTHSTFGSFLSLKAVNTEGNEKSVSHSSWDSAERQQEQGYQPGKRFAIVQMGTGCSISPLAAFALYGSPP